MTCRKRLLRWCQDHVVGIVAVVSLLLLCGGVFCWNVFTPGTPWIDRVGWRHRTVVDMTIREFAVIIFVTAMFHAVISRVVKK